MAGFTRILTLICVAGGHLSPASPVLRPAVVVPAWRNVSLPCSLTSIREITWYVLRSEQLLPLLTVTCSEFVNDTLEFHTEDNRRMCSVGALKRGPVSLRILEVEEKDAGLYFCTGKCGDTVCVSRGIRLAVDGGDVEPARLPCWSLGICALPAFIALCVVVIVGFCLCSGKPAVCCCHPARGDINLTEDGSLHYSSLKLADLPRPPSQGATALVKEDVTYSTVAARHTSRDGR